MGDVHLDQDICDVCGLPIRRYVHTYTLGRRDSAPVQAPDRWRHTHDNSLACEKPDDVRAN